MIIIINPSSVSVFFAKLKKLFLVCFGVLEPFRNEAKQKSAFRTNRNCYVTNMDEDADMDVQDNWSGKQWQDSWDRTD